MTLSTQAAEEISNWIAKELDVTMCKRERDLIAAIIAKVTGCDELLELLKQCEPIVEHDAQDLPYSPVLNTIRATLSRLQPQAPTNRNPDA